MVGADLVDEVLQRLGPQGLDLGLVHAGVVVALGLLLRLAQLPGCGVLWRRGVLTALADHNREELDQSRTAGEPRTGGGE